jgi:ElaB/YqjD/DUF883 family membrane-anchored ribosome-binding protein
MSVDTLNNAPASATTSSSERLADANLSEEKYLDLEAARTRAAVGQTLEELKDSLRAGLDVRVWTARHPWAAVGVAAATGFAAAAAVRSAAHARTDTLPSTNGAGPQQAAVYSGATNGQSKPTKDSPIVKGLFELAKVAIEASIMAAGKAVAANQAAANEAAPPPNCSRPPDPESVI